uniref:NrS-1 polymerase-like helicase domain-containing protein n=1 Tax=Nephroselmis olivacea TaxID=31312 RepID=Q9T3B0_NEPOL|nr:hypothetical protein NeolCp090 [Nephroselmis olivacea]NP_050952.1 hypothetical protein NeolCp147 [Nephroselmis olivacea]AAD54866.1 unknown [Nephroselmis olivacea]AAD54923.1 unknown [Nephroselmis olivacea]
MFVMNMVMPDPLPESEIQRVAYSAWQQIHVRKPTDPETKEAEKAYVTKYGFEVSSPSSDKLDPAKKMSNQFFLANRYKSYATCNENLKVAYDAERKGFVYWTQENGCWTLVDQDMFETMLFNFIIDEELLVRPYTTTEDFVKKVVGVLRKIVPSFSTSDMLVNGANLIDAVIQKVEEGLQTIDPSSDHNFMYQVPLRLGPLNQLPPLTDRFKEALIRLVGPDPADLNRLRLFFHHCLTYQPGSNIAFLLSGDQGTGKSTLEKIVTKLLGEDRCHAMRLAELHNESARTALRNARVLFVNEVYELETGTPAFEILKTLTGRDLVSNKVLYVGFFKFTFRGVVVLLSNKPEKDLGSGFADFAMRDRVIEIPNPAQERRTRRPCIPKVPFVR